MPQLKILKNVVDKMKNLSNCLVSVIGSEKQTYIFRIVKSNKIKFLVSQPKRMLWVLK